jgi:hypothetical protein
MRWLTSNPLNLTALPSSKRTGEFGLPSPAMTILRPMRSLLVTPMLLSSITAGLCHHLPRPPTLPSDPHRAFNTHSAVVGPRFSPTDF